MKKYLFLIILVLTSCQPLTTNSPMVKDIQMNIRIQSELTKKLSENQDKISDHLGLGLKSLTPEFKEALAKIQDDNNKKYELLDAKLTDFMTQMLKKGAEVVGASVGIPPALTAGAIAIATVAGKQISDVYATRRRERDAQERAEELADEAEKKKKEHEDWVKYIAGLDPDEAEKAIKANGV